MDKFKGMRFCEECDNVMDAKEHRTIDENRFLQFECKLCGFVLKAKEGCEIENCVYRTDYTQRAETLYVDPECVMDPTLTRRKDVKCPACGHYEAVTFT